MKRQIEKKDLGKGTIVRYLIILLIVLTLTRYSSAEIVTEGYRISIDSVDLIIEPGDISRYNITITNLENKLIEVSLKVDGNVTRLIELDKEGLSIAANSEENFIV